MQTIMFLNPLFGVVGHAPAQSGVGADPQQQQIEQHGAEGAEGMVVDQQEATAGGAAAGAAGAGGAPAEHAEQAPGGREPGGSAAAGGGSAGDAEMEAAMRVFADPAGLLRMMQMYVERGAPLWLQRQVQQQQLLPPGFGPQAPAGRPASHRPSTPPPATRAGTST